ncbi:hypothetical protein [Streptomyces spinosirectus]
MTDTQRTDTELLAELAPLAGVIADKLRTVPVRLGPGGTDDLISELTLAVAVYVGRHVLPAEALELRQPPRPADHTWSVETRWNDGRWVSYGGARYTAEQGQEMWQHTLDDPGPHAFRLVRATTTYAVEAEHTPEQQP